MSEIGHFARSIRDSAVVLDGAAGELAAAIGQLEDLADNLAEPWGTGLVGSTVGELYTDIHHMALSCYEDTVEVVDEYVRALTDTAELIKANEEGNTAAYEKIAATIVERFGAIGQPR